MWAARAACGTGAIELGARAEIGTRSTRPPRGARVTQRHVDRPGDGPFRRASLDRSVDPRQGSSKVPRRRSPNSRRALRPSRDRRPAPRVVENGRKRLGPQVRAEIRVGPCGLKAASGPLLIRRLPPPRFFSCRRLSSAPAAAPLGPQAPRRGARPRGSFSSEIAGSRKRRTGRNRRPPRRPESAGVPRDRRDAKRVAMTIAHPPGSRRACWPSSATSPSDCRGWSGSAPCSAFLIGSSMINRCAAAGDRSSDAGGQHAAFPAGKSPVSGRLLVRADLDSKPVSAVLDSAGRGPCVPRTGERRAVAGQNHPPLGKPQKPRRQVPADEPQICRGMRRASITRIGADRPRIVSTIARSIAARCRVIFHRPQLTLAANKRGVSSELTRLAIFDVEWDMQDLQDNRRSSAAGIAAVNRRRRMPGSGSVAETARAAPLGQRQLHGPRFSFEDFLPQGRSWRYRAAFRENVESPPARAAKPAGVDRARRATELLGRQIHFPHRALQGFDDFLRRTAAHRESEVGEVGEEFTGTGGSTIRGAGFPSPPVTIPRREISTGTGQIKRFQTEPCERAQRGWTGGLGKPVSRVAKLSPRPQHPPRLGIGRADVTKSRSHPAEFSHALRLNAANLPLCLFPNDTPRCIVHNFGRALWRNHRGMRRPRAVPFAGGDEHGGDELARRVPDADFDSRAGTPCGARPNNRRPSRDDESRP